MQNTTDNAELIDLSTARALTARGFAVIPTNSDADKRPLASFATAKSWRDFSDRLPTDAELLGWFGPRPRRGGIVLHEGQMCIDWDTKDSPPAPSLAPTEETAHGFHQFWRCAEGTRTSHDREAKIDYLSYGAFVRLCDPSRLLAWQGELPIWEGRAPARQLSADSDAQKRVPPAQTLLAALKSQGWRIGSRAANGWFPLTNGTKTAALSEDGSTLKMFSTTLCEAPEEPERTPPAILSHDALKTAYPEVPSPLVHGLLRHGETMLLFGKPKVQKSLRCLALANAVSRGGEWAGFQCERGKVLVIDNETHPAILADRYERIAAKNGDDGEGVDFLPVWDCEYTVEDMLRDAPHFRERGYALVIFDILARGLPDWCESESDNRQCAKVWACVQKTAALTGAAVVVVHHARKSATADIVSDPSGAGWTRYASTIASLSKKGTEPGVWLEAVTRSFPSPAARKM